MVYSATVKKAIGDVRNSLAGIGIVRQHSRFAGHGVHTPDANAPTVLVACSGGRDSMALAAVSQIVSGMLGIHCGAVIIDHRLQDGSEQVSKDAADRCTALGLGPVIVRSIDVKGAHDGHSAEDMARQARYEAIINVARQIGHVTVLLAHTRDDQAETVAMDLMRSSGIEALCGMPAAFVQGGVCFDRPFLDLTRAQTTAICRELGIAWWDDPTNGDTEPADQSLPANYPLRSRVRHTLMPYLSSFFGGDFSAHLAQGAGIARVDRDFLEASTDDWYRKIVCWNEAEGLRDQRGRNADVAADTRSMSDQGLQSFGSDCKSEVGCGERADAEVYTHLDRTLILRVKPLAQAHSAIRRRVIARVLAQLGLSFTSRHVLSIETLVTHWHGQGFVSLPSGYSANRQRDVIHLCKNR
ncbi:tRNA(Ile)-lysidine synthase [Bifidobacterium commune]|uniref:tRNA(Ile)-lysidine synthase n=1 Tax=Bifidobacterium commune TaxID=1505727 RepID=A0A1C4H3R5_9BIFI|nr:tRNA lysidine(34) synthetase TilS [Bifidobacterium commune]MBB2955087.1 tRNA(Ile)-lysidine synthase [Bifidobacterium commune]SCC79423.1 tRNA(Ile)-lysidine synthase [Bifidobacterium commune]